MLVMKFGGSSVADAERIRQVAGIVENQLEENPIVVLSAMGDTTDHLLEAAETALNGGKVSVEKIRNLHAKTMGELGLSPGVQAGIAPLFGELENLLEGISRVRELTGRTKDSLVSFGERLSVRIAAAYFETRKITALALDAWDAGFVSDSGFTRAELLPESWDLIPKTLLPLVRAGTVPVITGFIARDEKGSVTTLGRGGSDLSATLIAASCGALEAQIWKDVDGILTADPRIVKKARPVETVTYEEAAELAYFGAQVLHPRAMQPCQKTGTPVLVKNTFNPGAPGTRIVSGMDKKTSPVRAITSKKNVTLVDVVSTRMLGQYGFLEEVFAAFARSRISVDMVATSEVSISLTLDTDNDLEGLKNDLDRIAGVEIKKNKAIVTIIGDVRRSSEILVRTFRTCQILGVTVQMVSQGASKVNISFIVNDTEAAQVVRALHADFFEAIPMRSP
jgi:aspartate kinase